MKVTAIHAVTRPGDLGGIKAERAYGGHYPNAKVKSKRAGSLHTCFEAARALRRVIGSSPKRLYVAAHLHRVSHELAETISPARGHVTRRSVGRTPGSDEKCSDVEPTCTL